MKPNEKNKVIFLRPNHGTSNDHSPRCIENMAPRCPRIVQMGMKIVANGVRMVSSWLHVQFFSNVIDTKQSGCQQKVYHSP